MRIVNYEESFGEITFPQGFAERLTGLTIEEQMGCYRTTTYDRFHNTGWKSRRQDSGYSRLEKDPDVTALIVKDGLLVGIMVKNHNNREQACLPEGFVCTYYAEDNNGAGYKTRSIFTHLVCIPENFAQNEDNGNALFRQFRSLQERAEAGGHDALELQFCTLPQKTPLELRVEVSGITHGRTDSLYVTDAQRFLQIYGHIFADGLYNNLQTGPVDVCGINYYAPERVMSMMVQVRREAGQESEVLAQWLDRARWYNGFYVLGV